MTDDDASARDALERLLRVEGFDVDTAADGLAAVELEREAAALELEREAAVLELEREAPCTQGGPRSRHSA